MVVIHGKLLLQNQTNICTRGSSPLIFRDDHEVLNNWYPTEIVGAPSFPNGTRDSLLAGFALTALREFNPIYTNRTYRSQQYGAGLELFFLDMRSFRGPNDNNLDPAGNNSALGPTQTAWLKKALLNSKAVWKVISNHDPLTIVTGKLQGTKMFRQS